MKRFVLIAMLLGLFFHANAYHWDVNINKYPTTMSVIGVVSIDGVEQTTNAIEVGAFCGNECRGREMLMGDYYSMFNHYYVFLTVYGNNNDALYFRLYDHNTGEELTGNCTNTATFVVNGTLGDPGSPYVFNYLSPTVFTITAVADPTAGGTVDGGGTYENGATCTLTATANENYAFLNWSTNGTVVSSEPNYSFVVNGDANYVAHFTSQFTYTINATSNPAEAGIVSGSGNYLEGTPCTLSAVPANIGYTFVNWTNNGNIVSTSNDYSFVVTEDADYEANFQINSFQITAAVTPLGAGTVSGTGSYNWGETCTLTATPANGYAFSHWMEDGIQVSTDANYSFVVDGSRNLSAQFEESTSGNYHWDVNIHQYPTTMTFFSVIEIDGEEQMTDQLEIGAFCNGVCRGRERPTDMYFQQFNKYYVFMTVYGNDGDELHFRLYDHRIGHELDLNCSNMERFSTNASFGSPNAPYVFDFYSQIVVHTISASAHPTQGGNIEGAGDYDHGASCTLTASANSGYAFDNWTENGEVVSTSSTYSFTVTADRTLVANFTDTPVDFVIAATASPTDGGSVAGEGTYTQGSICTLTATANNGYVFNNWTENGDVVSSDANYSFTVSGDRSLVANFTVVSSGYHWDVNIHTYPTTMTVMGIIKIDGEEQFSNNLEIGAFCNGECRGREKTTDIYYNMIGHYVMFLTLYGNNGDHLNFRLYDHGIGQELDLTCLTTMTFIVNASYGDPVSPFVYDFVSTIRYNVSAVASPTEGGSVNGPGVYDENTLCALTATANTGYHFVNWTLNDVVVSSEPEYTFIVTEDIDLVAHFELNSYEIVAESDPTEGGSILGAGIYSHFETCVLTATANTGYTFINWTKDGVVVSTQSEYDFVVTGAIELVAHFELNSYDITADADPNEGGYVAGAATYHHFDICTLTANPAYGYHFVNWTNDVNDVVSTEMVYSFEVTGPAHFVAHFELNSYDILVEAHPSQGGAAYGGGTFIHGTTCTLTAEPEEQFIFSNWSKGSEIVSTESTYTFTVTESATYVANFERVMVTQNTNIYSGWNWYSTYIEQSEVDGMHMLQQSLGDIGKRIKAQDGSYQENYPVIGWMGLLNNLSNEASYQILATGTGEISMTGPVVHPSDHPITLYPGWNWIGYPCIADMDIATAFSGLTPTLNDQVKVADLYANYYPQLGGWFGFLQNLTPGMGLLYLSRNPEPVTFTYPEVDRYIPTTKNTTFEDGHWHTDRHAYPNNMTISAVVELDDEELQSSNYELAVFANGECRGNVNLNYFEPVNRYLALLVVSGDEDVVLNFGLYNTETGMEYFSDTFIGYNTNDALGTPMEPFKVVFRSNTATDELTASTHVYPNPVQNGGNFSIGLTTDSEVRVEIFNAAGELVKAESNAKSPVSITAPNVAGVYTLRIITNSKSVCHKRLIVN